jgi:TolA-binding protein
MNKHCKGCKREITWGGKDCPFCGTGQNIVRYYLPHLVTLLFLASLATWVAYSYIEQTTEQIRQNVTEQLQTQIKAEQQQSENLKKQITQLQNELRSTQQQLSEFQTQQSNNFEDAEAKRQALQQQLEEAQQEAERQKGRANWLGKENLRLKTELESLKQHIANLEKSSDSLNKPSMGDAPSAETLSDIEAAKVSDSDGDQ